VDPESVEALAAAAGEVSDASGAEATGLAMLCNNEWSGKSKYSALELQDSIFA
jgi:hypothetical protein